MNATFAIDDWVVVARRLGRIKGPKKLNGATGWLVQFAVEHFTEGYLPSFVDTRSIARAELGVNVCKTPRGGCSCGLLHVPTPEWLER